MIYFRIVLKKSPTITTNHQEYLYLFWDNSQWFPVIHKPLWNDFGVILADSQTNLGDLQTILKWFWGKLQTIFEWFMNAHGKKDEVLIFQNI